MSQFKRFNSSDNTNWDTNFAHPSGTLTWDPNLGLRLHDGSTGGGNQVGGGFPTNQGGGALNTFLFGGGTSANNGKFMRQNTNLDAEWASLPTTYDSLTISTVTGNGGDDLLLQGGAASPTGQLATSNSPSYGYGNQLAIFQQSDFTSGQLSDIQVGSVVVDANGVAGNVTVIGSNGYPGGFELDIQWTGATPYTYYSGYGDAKDVKIQADTKVWTFTGNGNLMLPDGGDIKGSDGATAFVSLATLKSIVAASTDFADFKTRISNI